MATYPRGGEQARNVYVSDLVEQIVAMNDGHYLETLIDAMPTEFCTGVASYPEKHYAAPNHERDIMYLKRKVEAGACYTVTQMCFNNQAYFDFVRQCSDAGITVPVILGLKILTSARQLRTIPRNFHVNIPEALAAEMEAASHEQMAYIGVAWAVCKGEELLTAGAPCLHFYVTSIAPLVRRVVERLRSRGAHRSHAATVARATPTATRTIDPHATATWRVSDLGILA